MHHALKRAAVALALAVTALPALAAPENRCGWVVNPTPGNWWLTDRDGDWVLSFQGQETEVPGMERIGDLSAGDYVATNGSYGYACGCMKVETDATGDPKRVTSVLSFRQLPIAQCRADKSLPKPE